MSKNEILMQRKIDEMKVELTRLKNSSSRKVLDIAFLFASPLLYRDSKGLFNSPELDFVSEMKNIKKAVYKSNKAIKFMSKVATKQSFSDILRTGPRILHISCHGRINREKNESCLILEDQNEPGKGVIVSEQQVERILRNGKMSDFELVFLAACHS